MQGYCPGHYKQYRDHRPLAKLQQLWRTDAELAAQKLAGEKRCRGCHQTLPLSKFHRDIHARDGLTARCARCAVDYQLEKKYGTGAVAWKKKRLAEQGGECAMCHTDDPKARDWHLDHDHKTGAWRDVLCAPCNTKLGMAEKMADNPFMQAHLRKHGIELQRIA